MRALLYLITVSTIYLHMAFFSDYSIEIVQTVWLLVCSLPLWLPPLARLLKMRTLWQ